MKIRFVILFIALLLYFVPTTTAFAQSDYVLPYPGAMPGNRLYTISKIVDYIQSWWSFGNLSQFTYQLSMADKKLVEAKTLFEYKQYLLASDGLARYQSHLKNAAFFLKKAEDEGKNVSQKRALFFSAIQKHEEVLGKIKNATPAVFIWEPERNTPTTIEMHNMIDKAIELGRTYNGI